MLTDDVVVQIPVSYAVYQGDLDAFLDEALSQQPTLAERRYLHSLKGQDLPKEAGLIMAFRASSLGPSGTEVMFVTVGGPPIDWSSFPEDQWLASGLPPGASEASVSHMTIGGGDAVLLRYFDPAVSGGVFGDQGSWVTILQFNAAGRAVSVSVTTSQQPNRELDLGIRRIAESVASVSD